MKKSKLILTLTAVASTATLVTPIVALATSCFGTTSNTDFNLIKTSTGYCIDGLKATDRSKITSIVVPETINGTKVVEISKGAFKGCTNLETITLPFIGHSETASGKGGLFGYIFGDEMYEGCGGYTWQEYSTNDYYEATDVEYAEFAIPSTIKTVNITNCSRIPAGAFSNCRFIRNINITTQQTNDDFTIENYAFYGCRYLRSFTIPSSTKVIGRKAFQACYNLKEITIPSGVTTIKHNAFSNCISATTATIPSTVENMGKYVFENFTSGVVMLEDEDTEIAKKNWDSEWVEQSISVVYGYSSGGLHYTDDAIIALCGKNTNEQYGFIVQWIGSWEAETITLPSQLTVDGVNYPIRKVGPHVFYGNDATKTFIIPNSITSISANAFENCTALEYVKFGDGLKTIGAEAFIGCSKLHGHIDSEGKEQEGIDFNNVTTIGNRAFTSLWGIQSISFNCIETIGESAFEDCAYLAPLRTNKKGVITNHELIFPKTIKSIGASAFKYACKFKTDNPESGEFTYENDADVIFESGNTNTVEFGESCFEQFGVRSSTTYYKSQIKIHMNFNSINVDEFQNSAFKEACMYGMYNFPTNVTTFGDYSFSNSFTVYTNKNTSFSTARDFIVPKTTKHIGNYAFYNNYQMSISLEDGNTVLESIGNGAFQSCYFAGTTANPKGTDEFIIPNSVKTIGSSAFASCSALKKVKLPINDKFTRLEASTFSGCTKLGTYQSEESATFENSALEIPASVTYIGGSAFNNCKVLKYVNVLGNITTLGSSAFANCCELEHDPSNNKIALKFADNLSSLTSLGTSVYLGCTKMVWAPFPQNNRNITSIPNSSFDACSSLTDFEVLDAVTSIGEYAFRRCYAIQSITGMNAVKYIYKNAFYECTGLKEFAMPSGCHTICENAFAYCTNLGLDTNPTKFILPKDIDQAWSSSTSRGMGTSPFIGWTKLQTIYFTEANIESVDASGNITTKWGWVLLKQTEGNDTYYTCKASGSDTVKFKQTA